jgi:hypothetical protein
MLLPVLWSIPAVENFIGGTIVKVNPSPSNHRNCTLIAARLLCLALLAVLFLPSLMRAQDTGYISGTVVDKTGAAVVAANVTIVSITGNLTRDTVTNGDGAYTVAGLPGGTYTITVSAQGFQKFIAQKVVLDVGQKARVDVTLNVGQLSEEVVVNGENVAQVDTQSAELGATITGKQVNDLVLNGRNFTQLVNLTPGVVNQTGSDEGKVGVNGNVSYAINGGRTEYNNWELDGGDNMDNGSNTTLNVYPNPEAIAEFKVLTSNYGAQYGRNGSGTIEVETKSGTSQFHGSAFEYVRNDMFNATPWANGFTDSGKPSYKKNDFGYTFGGPIFLPHIYHPAKAKTFFFWSQEWRREKNPGGQINQNVPSSDERSGNFSDVCPTYTGAAFSRGTFPDCPYTALNTVTNTGTPYVNNSVTVDPTGAALLQLIPNSNGTTNGFPAYISDQSYPTTWREELVRVDHNFTDNERITFRYIHDSWKTVTQMPLWSAYTSSFDNINTQFAGPGTSFVTRLTSNITPTLLNEFVASYTADHILLGNTGPISLPSGFGLTPLYNNGLGGKIPAISIGDGLAYGGGFGVDTAYMPWKNANPTYTYRDNVTKIIGNHTLIIGAYFVAAQKNQENSVDTQGLLTFATSNPNTTGNAFADLLTGQIAGYSQTSQQLIFYDRYKLFEPYFQDDWRVTKKFTLNLGLRWSLYGRYQERYNQEYGFSPAQFVAANAPTILPLTDPNGNAGLIDPATGNLFNGFIQCGAKGVTVGCMKNKWINPAPRIGFAWDPKGDGKTAIRGGYGIFFEHTNGNEANAETLQQGPSPLILNGSVSNITGYANVGAGAASFPAPLSPYSIPDQVQWPYVQQYNLDVQHEFPGNYVLSVAYVGSKGTHLTMQRDLNQLQPVPSGSNPYSAGQIITSDDCNSFSTNANGLPTAATVGGNPVTNGQVLQNLFVACGNSSLYYRPFQGYGTITRLENTANSTYNALQVSMRHTVGALQLSVAYTYSHSIDDSSDRYDTTFVNSYDPKATRASSNFDQRHNFVASYVYQLPFFKAPGLKHTLLGGWQASGITTIQTGVPLTVTDGTQFGDNAGVGNGIGSGSFLDSTGTSPYAVSAADKAAVAAAGIGALYYNPAAFQIPTGLTFGNVGRNTLRYPGRTNFDFGLFKRFAFKERYAFDFRWENFNIFNHTQLNAFSSTSDSCNGVGTNINATACGTSDFLVLNGAHDPRIMQFGLRFQF